MGSAGGSGCTRTTRTPLTTESDGAPSIAWVTTATSWPAAACASASAWTCRPSPP